jgi:tetratricopeptide (TPR) repeat protein
MDETMAAPITFVIPGQRQGAARGAAGGSSMDAAATLAGLGGQARDSVRVGARRAAGELVRVTATPGQDVVLLHIANGPSLVLHPQTARDLLLAQSQQKHDPRSRAAGEAAPSVPDEVAVPAQLQWQGLEQAAAARGATRGFLGDVLLSAVEVVTGLGFEKASSFVASQIVAKLDGAVDAGVYALQPESLRALKGTAHKCDRVPEAPTGAPILVLMHGTFVDTASTFGKLWALHSQRVRELFDHYDGRVYALDHPTLGASPIANALTLARALPQGARLHLLTHSRGGLVAEVLSRACSQRKPGADDITFFAGDEYTDQRRELEELLALVSQRDITVERLVRVACPARGTLLASKRLDAYVSVLKWGLELAGVPVAPVLVDFLGHVAQQREDPALLPGLAAMMPWSPLVQWLNTAEEPVAGQLRVVAGDIQGDSVTSWLKTLLADAFYWTDNDLIVQTRSMYGGTPREAGASFLLDKGAKVTHFGYFANERSVQAIVGALTQERPQGFRAIGPLSWAGKDAGGVRGAARSGPVDDRPPSARPAVFVLPGILGSHLKAAGKRIWLSLRIVGSLGRLAYRGDKPGDVQPDGPIGATYDDLIDYLGRTHEVIAFGFDWRRPIEEEARRLGEAVDAALNARNASGQPVRLLAHSMGGLVARTMQLECPQTWKRLMEREGARLLMLGTPNGGSWAPMAVLSGDDSFGNVLATFSAPFQDHKARQLMAEMPGFLQLQTSLLDASLNLDKEATWTALAAKDLAQVREHNWWHRNWRGEGDDDPQVTPYTWGVPPQDVLDTAVKLRRALDKQRDAMSGPSPGLSADRLLLVVGRAKYTPAGYEFGDDGLVYLNAPDGGDGRVTLDAALLPGVRTWELDCAHGDLPDKESAFEAYYELLTRGETGKLPRLAAAARSAGGRATGLVASTSYVRSRPSRGRSPETTPPDSMQSVFDTVIASPEEEAARPIGAALRITVLNGNLSFVRQPLIVGHYRALKLTGTERVVDALIGGAMREALVAGLYPDAVGTQQVFFNSQRDLENPWRTPRPEGVIVAGLGEEGKLRTTDLTFTVRQGVIAWAQRVIEASSGAPSHFELAATLIGSGGIGISAGSSARAIAQGVRDANERLALTGWPQVSHLTLVELYLDRAAEAWHGLQVMVTAELGRYDIAPSVKSGTGPLRRVLDSDYRGADYDFVTASTRRNDDEDRIGTADASVPGVDVRPSDLEATIAYTLDTRRARTEVRAQVTQGKLLRELLEGASNNANRDPDIGRTLFQLLVPPEMEPFLGGTSKMVLELDDGTACVPWELLDPPPDRRIGAVDQRPWAIRSQLIRKLRTEETFREQVSDASADDDVLVIGEPACDLKIYPPLPGARSEAQAVADLLRGAGGVGPERVRALVEDGADARTVINALLARRYRIVHIAGHGQPGRYGGVVLSGGTFLGPREIKTMRTVPELVFVNCCHLAARDASQTLRMYDRTAFAASVADQLIRIGVRCVVAAGWAVDDEPAKTFATTLYAALLERRTFIEAVAAAREAAWDGGRGGNTWAAYQCYGDPNWTYRREVGQSLGFGPSLVEQYAGIATPVGLTLALEALAVSSRFMGARPQAQQERIGHLDARFASQWGDMGAVAEAFGAAYAEAKATDDAIRWYERALQANDAAASMKASEQLGNLRARRAFERVQRAEEAAATDEGRRALEAALDTGRDEIGKALKLLEMLTLLQPTLERESLCGSACKRLAMLEHVAARRSGGVPDEKHQAVEMNAVKRMADHYRKAEHIARESAGAGLHHPVLNRMAAELVAGFDDPSWQGFSAEASATVRESLRCKQAEDPDFWSVAGTYELQLYEALAERKLSVRLDDLRSGYEDLRRRVSAGWMWASVRDQARFVLPPYQATMESGDDESAASRKLLELLDAWCKE